MITTDAIQCAITKQLEDDDLRSSLLGSKFLLLFGMKIMAAWQREGPPATTSYQRHAFDARLHAGGMIVPSSLNLHNIITGGIANIATVEDWTRMTSTKRGSVCNNKLPTPCILHLMYGCTLPAALAAWLIIGKTVYGLILFSKFEPIYNLFRWNPKLGERVQRACPICLWDSLDLALPEHR